ncbi:testis development-related protein [Trachemys scripta elegans]|uniref:testis development-related protein n=1 Tax=Trachemys scripta elegans TaxID=31138 RepID=UPI0015561E20|nr:testis development-related protein [Trachemys scripta elegans]
MNEENPREELRTCKPNQGVIDSMQEENIVQALKENEKGESTGLDEVLVDVLKSLRRGTIEHFTIIWMEHCETLQTNFKEWQHSVEQVELRVNVDKTEAIITEGGGSTIKDNTERELRRVKEFKYLGLMVADNSVLLSDSWHCTKGIFPTIEANLQNKDQFPHDEVTSSVSQLATKVQSAGFRGWKEVTSMFNKDDEQQLLAGCKAPKSKGTNLKLKEDVKSEKKSGFWDSLAIKQNTQSRKPDQIEGWEPPQITAGDPISDAGNTLSDYPSWSGWEDETKGSTKYTNLASSGNSSRWSIKSAGKLVSIRRQSKGNLTDNWEELE